LLVEPKGLPVRGLIGPPESNKVSPRAAQALMRHTDPRLTAGVYTDEKLLPLAAELVGVPAITASQ
jgi:hypothetical protein